jgi:hypothetical protein
MKDEVKENTIVEMTTSTGIVCTARVRWVNDKGQAGITYIAPDSHKGAASVVEVEELEVIQRDMGEDLKDVPTKDLVAAITRLRSGRLPKKMSARKPSVRKQSVKSKLDALFAEGGDGLDALITKAVKEIKEEEKGG